MQQYHDHYLLTDVLLLADVFEYFRRSVLNTHKFDRLHFITPQSLAWASSSSRPTAPLLCEQDELPDDVLLEAVVMIEELPHLSWQDVQEYFNALDSPIVISVSDEVDLEFSPPPPLHLSPTAMLTADDVISISSDCGSTLSSDSIEEESSIDSDSFSDVESLN